MESEPRLSPAEIARLLELVSLVAEERGFTPAQAIDFIAGLVQPQRGQSIPASVLADFAERFRRLRMRRNDLVGAPLFRDPAWDMLLALFGAHERGDKVSVSSLCYASGVPSTTALRQLARLEEHGLVVREGDRNDSRREFVKPTEKAISGITSVAELLLEETLAVDG